MINVQKHKQITKATNCDDANTPTHETKDMLVSNLTKHPKTGHFLYDTDESITAVKTNHY